MLACLLPPLRTSTLATTPFRGPPPRRKSSSPQAKESLQLDERGRPKGAELTRGKAGEKIHATASGPIPYFDRVAAVGEYTNIMMRRGIECKDATHQATRRLRQQSQTRGEMWLMFGHKLSNSHRCMPRGNDRILVSGNDGRGDDPGCKEQKARHLYSAMTARYLSSAARYSAGYLRSALFFSFLL